MNEINADLLPLVRPIASLALHAKNARRHDERNLKAVADSLAKYGQQKPIVVASDGVVMAGNGTLQAALRLGWTEIAAVTLTVDSTHPDARGYAIADNRSADLSTFDRDALLTEIDALRETTDLSALGFSDADMQLLRRVPAIEFFDFEVAKSARREVVRQDLADPRHATADAQAPDAFEARVKLGDLWQLGSHRLLCGDCTIAKNVDALFDGSTPARLLATDPPYGVSLSATKDGIPGSGFSNMQAERGELENDVLGGPSLQSFLEACFRAALPHLDRAAWYLWHAHLTEGFFAAAAAAAAANVVLHRQIIWKKPGFVLTRSGMWHWAHEPCFFGWVKGERPEWYEDQSQTSVWECGRDESVGFHQTQKPVDLFARPMRAHTLEGDICYEPFCGSGSQVIAGELLKRRVFACEISPHFCDGILDRWERFVGNGAKAEKVGFVDQAGKMQIGLSESEDES